ncbi:ATP-binding protein [Thioclava sp. ES.031]|uniref:ATP-binding protein n=1 Tax=Thioclava sp. ES.031 TaxID=1798203 RepID=UPI001145DC65|nr:ATP-binding protein [Thioclava sp. ES.031]
MLPTLAGSTEFLGYCTSIGIVVTAAVFAVFVRRFPFDVLAAIASPVVNAAIGAADGEARDERRLLRLQKQMVGYKLLIIDELGFVPLSKTGAELLFELISQRYERGATMITSNLPFDEWTETFGSERLTGALLDRLTHHVHILEMNGDSYRLAQSRARNSADT